MHLLLAFGAFTKDPNLVWHFYPMRRATALVPTRTQVIADLLGDYPVLFAVSGNLEPQFETFGMNAVVNVFMTFRYATLVAVRQLSANARASVTGHIVIPLAVQLWALASTAAEKSALVPEKSLWVYLLNPTARIIGDYRGLMIGRTHVFDLLFLASACPLALVSFCCLTFFKGMEIVVANTL